MTGVTKFWTVPAYYPWQGKGGVSVIPVKPEPASPGYRRHAALVQYVAASGAFMPQAALEVTFDLCYHFYKQNLSVPCPSFLKPLNSCVTAKQLRVGYTASWKIFNAYICIYISDFLGALVTYRAMAYSQVCICLCIYIDIAQDTCSMHIPLYIHGGVK